MDHLNAWNAHDLYAITFALRVNLHDTYLRYNCECAGRYNNSVAVVRALFIQHCGGKFARSVAESLRETFVHHLWRHRPVCNVVVSKVAWCFSTQTWLRFRADIADYSPSILDINILAIIVILNMVKKHCYGGIYFLSCLYSYFEAAFPIEKTLQYVIIMLSKHFSNRL